MLFNSLVIIIGNIVLSKKRSGDMGGYVPLTNIWNELIKNDSVKFSNNNPGTNKIIYYKNFIEYCKRNGIKLFVFASPYFKKFRNADYSVSKGKEIAKDMVLIFRIYN